MSGIIRLTARLNEHSHSDSLMHDRKYYKVTIIMMDKDCISDIQKLYIEGMQECKSDNLRKGAWKKITQGD